MKTSIIAGWADAPHLDQAAKDALMSSYLPHELDARTKGTPSLGAGAIYPVAQSEFVVAPFAVPKHWKWAYGLDVGWKLTAAVWGALDSEADILYLVGEYYRAMAEPAIHAAAIRAHGTWIPGVVDPASRGRSQHDGEQLMHVYRELGLKLVAADNSVYVGILEVWQRLSSGRLKVFSNLQNWLVEHRIYRRDEKGNIVKANDHLMDASRYLCVSGVPIASFRPKADLLPIVRAPETEYNPWSEVQGETSYGRGR